MSIKRARYTTDRARPGLVSLHDIRPGNGAGQFLQPRSLHGTSRWWNALSCMKMSHISFIQNCCCNYVSKYRTYIAPKSIKESGRKLYNCKFHNIKDEHLDIITSLIVLMLTMLPSLCLINSKETVSSNQCLCCSTGLKLSWPKTKLQNVGVGDPSSTILRSRLICCPSHNWSSTAWWLTIQGRRSWGLWGSWPPKICENGQSMSHSQHQGWTDGYNHFTDPSYSDNATILVSDQPQGDSAFHPINAFAAIQGFKLSWLKTSTPKREYRWPAVNNPYRWCTSWRSRGFHLP